MDTPFRVRLRFFFSKPVTDSLKVIGIVLTLLLRGLGVMGAKVTVGGEMSLVALAILNIFLSVVCR